MAGGAGQLGIDDEAVAVLHQHVADEAELRLHAGALAVEPRVGVGGRGVGLVRPPLAAEVAVAVPPAGRRLAGAVLRPEALHAGPGLDQRAVDAEVLARQQPPHLRPVEQRRQELGRDVALEQPVAVLGEGRVVPDRIVDAEPDEPAEQEVEVEPLHQLPLRADRVEGLQQQRPQQLLGRDRGPAERRVELGEDRRQLDQRRVDDRPGSPAADALPAPGSPGRRS